MASVSSGQIYTSTNSGSTWTARDSSREWADVASSSDGTKLVAAVAGGQIYTSTDSGVSWTARDSNRAWANVASSSDGVVLYANQNDMFGNTGTYISLDSGVTWSLISSNPSATSYIQYNGIATSQYGDKFYAASWDGYVYKTSGSVPTLTSVAITGSPFIGSTLTAVPTGANETSFRTTYVWERSSDQISWTTISNSNSTYTLVSADNSKYVRVVVTRINDIGSSSGLIATTTTLVSNPPSVGSATITGTAVVGQTLTATASTVNYYNCSNGILSYQWQSSSDGSTNWTNIGSATSTTFVLTSSQLSTYIRVQITPSTDCGSGSAATSSATAAVTGVPTIGSASITGTAAEGQTLTATANSVTGTSVTTTYQWQSATTSDGVYSNISLLATSQTFVLTSSQAAQFIKVKITVTNVAGNADATSSATTEVIGAPTIGSASITGTVAVGQTLTATANTVTGTSVTTTYQWQSAATSGGSYTDIGSATLSTYLLPTSQVTKFIKVKITVTNAGGTANTTSSATTAVSKTTPTIFGFANTEVLLSAGTYAITAPTANVAGTFSYSSSDSLTVSFANASIPTATLVQLGAATITATFTPTDTTGYNSNTATMVLTVSLTITSPAAADDDGAWKKVTPVVIPKADYILTTTKSRRLATTTLVNKLNAQVVKDRTRFIYNKNTKFSIFGTSKNVCKIQAGYLVPIKTGACELWVKPTTLGSAGNKYWVRIVVKK